MIKSTVFLADVCLGSRHEDCSALLTFSVALFFSLEIVFSLLQVIIMEKRILRFSLGSNLQLTSGCCNMVLPAVQSKRSYSLLESSVPL